MQAERVLKWCAFGSMALTVPVLAAATVFEKLFGTEFARTHIYVALPMLMLWGFAAFASLLYILKRRMFRRPATFCLHLSFVIILAGALTTHLTGSNGHLHLRTGDPPADSFTLADGTAAKLPFSVSLKEFRKEYSEGSFAPSDFASTLLIDDGGTRHTAVVSMNNIHTHRHYRLYQSGYDADGRGTVLSVARDPAGIAVTYTGYLWLLLSMVAFFTERNSTFRRLLRSGIFALALLATANAGAAPRTLPQKTAAEFCRLKVCHNDRICSLQSLAEEFALEIYGRTTYCGLTAEQILTGWFFFYDDWKYEPVIKVKGGEIKTILGARNGYARLTDFTGVEGYRLEPLLRSEGSGRRNALYANAKFNLISSLCTGTLLKIYPVAGPSGIVWHSPADRPDEDMPYEQWIFIRRSLDLVAERVAMNDNAGAAELLSKIAKYQLDTAGDTMPSAIRGEAERLYNRTEIGKPLAMFCLTAGIIAFLIFCLCTALQTGRALKIRRPLEILLFAIFAYLTLHILLRWFVSRHIPLSNGFETMRFMAWCATALTLAVRRRLAMALPFGLLVCGFALLASTIGGASPRITNLMPVLNSPLLSLHVAVIMAAYTLLAFTMLNGAAAIIITAVRRRADEQTARLRDISRVILCPAVFLLTAGIFIGALWANISWGRYWGWDPKEVWALITLLIYSAPLHAESMPLFRRPVFFHVYCISAFMAVLITYFGVNFILGGMHAYA